MLGGEKPHSGKDKEIMNDELWRQLYAYIASCLGLSKFKMLDFVAQSVP
jgi:hypothetical protein